MKHNNSWYLKIFCSIIYSLFFLCSIAQSNPVTSKVISNIAHTIKLIREDSISELSMMVQYPLRRPNPVPDIYSSGEFVSYYHILMNDSFKTKIVADGLGSLFYAQGNFAILYGNVWFDKDGTILSIGSSGEELKLKADLTREILKSMYPGIKPWIENQLVIKSKTFLARIDETKDGYRYISWNNGKKISEKPDIILFSDDQEFLGSQGGVQYTFKNGDWTYIIIDDYMSEEEAREGVHLHLLYKGKEKHSYKCEKLK